MGRNHLMEIKGLFRLLGFHHTWGQWISNTNKSNRIIIEITKNMIHIDMTKRGNHYNLDNDRISINKRDVNLFFVKTKLEEYFL